MRFLFVDKIFELEPGKRIKAGKRLAASEELFRDHLPGFPVVPAVLLTEMMGQAAKNCLDSETTRSGYAMLTRIASANFRTWVKPDEEVVIHAEITQNRPDYATANCFLEVAGKKVCSAELFFVFIPKEHFAPGYRSEVLEAYWQAHAGQ